MFIRKAAPSLRRLATTEAELARMREALEPFARDAEGIHPGWAGERRRSSLTQAKPLTVADFRRAREALGTKP